MATDVHLPEVQRPLWNKLNDKEQTIMGWVKLGKENRQIALLTGSSEQMVKNRLREIFLKIAVFNRTQAVAVLLEEKHRAELAARR